LRRRGQRKEASALTSIRLLRNRQSCLLLHLFTNQRPVSIVISQAVEFRIG
jgi:hypothetical protein